MTRLRRYPSSECCRRRRRIKDFQGVCESVWEWWPHDTEWLAFFFSLHRALVWFWLGRFSLFLLLLFPLASADPVPFSKKPTEYREPSTKVCVLLCFFLHPTSLKCPYFLQSVNSLQTPPPTFGQTFILSSSSPFGSQRLSSSFVAPIGWS